MDYLRVLLLYNGHIITRQTSISDIRGCEGNKCPWWPKDRFAAREINKSRLQTKVL